MADIDEDPLLSSPRDRTPGQNDSNNDDNLSENEDEQTQDFRFLNTSKTNASGHLLPRRGEKDFEPHGTQAQSSTLAASQAAMHEALSFERSHGPESAKASVPTGVFDAETGLTFVAKEIGGFFKTMGTPVKGGSGGVMLEPEEALWLCERGTLLLKYPDLTDSNRGPEAKDTESLDGVTMSVQAAYACCIGSRYLTLERYVIYAGLKRSGYSVFRAKGGWNDNEDAPSHEQTAVITRNPISTLQSWFQSLLHGIFYSTPNTKTLPLIGTTFFRDYRTIYNSLSLIPSHQTHSHPLATQPQNSDPDHEPLSITYHAYKPSTPLKKSLLPSPDFNIIVLDARETTFPTATQLSSLLATLIPESPPTAGTAGKPMNLYATLKSGRTSVILAVVDCGLPSYIRVSEGVFAGEKVWERNPLINPVRSDSAGGRGGKGGKMGGRGRGRGRGRGKG